MYHKIIIIGNLGGDPQMRYTQTGVPVTSFSVASNRRWTNQDGSQGEETIWFRISAWRNLAETCNKYLSKGRQVYIEGRLNPDPQTGGPRLWTGNDGQTRASFEVTALEVKFLGGRGDTGGFAGEPGVAAPEEGDITEDEIPF